jgi:hypothetical protein
MGFYQDQIVPLLINWSMRQKRALHPPRIGMVLVAAAGPMMNIGLAVVVFGK